MSSVYQRANEINFLDKVPISFIVAPFLYKFLVIMIMKLAINTRVIIGNLNKQITRIVVYRERYSKYLDMTKIKLYIKTMNKAIIVKLNFCCSTLVFISRVGCCSLCS